MMSTILQRNVSFPLPSGKSCPRQETAVKDQCNGIPQPQTQPQTDISPVSVISLTKVEVATPKIQGAIISEEKTGESAVCGVSNVIQKLQEPFLPSKKKRKTFPTSQRLSTLASVAFAKPRKRKVEDLQLNAPLSALASVATAKSRKLDDSQKSKPALKKSHALPPPTLASCNRHVIGANLRLPRSFTNCEPKRALKYARMRFPFSDRHKCALVPTALFSYGRFACKNESVEAKNNQPQKTTAKYNFRRRVWLLVPHRLAPADVVTRKVNGPREPVRTRK